MSQHSPISPDELAHLRHELLTPLNQILGYSEMLEEDAQAAGQSAAIPDIKKIQLAARQLNTVITEKLGAATPIPNPSKTRRPAAKEHSHSDRAATPLHGRVLVADDHPGNLEMLASRLKRHGLEVSTATNGAEAIETLRARPFDLVLLDVLMPVLDGYQTLLQIKADPKIRHIPVIMVSALDELDNVVHCIEAGAEDYLPKPFNPVLLHARISVSLEKKALAQASRRHLQTLEETQRRLDKELAEASRYVRSILPGPLQEPFRVDWLHEPSSEIGGDAFGYHWIDPDHFAIYLLDVCGHGVAASLLSVSAINVVRSGALPGTDFRDPSAVLAALNTAFPMERQNNMYFTMWYGVFHFPTRTLRHASGGHPPALLLDHTGLQRLHAPGIVVGVMPESIFPSETCHIAGDAVLHVLSDGCYESLATTGGRGEFEEFEELVKSHGRSEKILAEILARVRHDQCSIQLRDDFSILRVHFPA